MRIAVPSNGRNICAHFGHCENFNIYDTKEGHIAAESSVPNPGHKPGFLPNFLNEIGVKVIMSGGMGGGAVQIFSEKGIEVFTGVRGSAVDAVESYMSGSLESTGSICHEHAHIGECGE